MSDETKIPMYGCKLTAHQVMHLDGLCGDEIQKIVESARRQLVLEAEGVPAHISSMVTTACEVAENQGRLIHQRRNITRCPCCGRTDGYWPVKRSTSYKVKGRPDFDKPKVFSGYELRRSFITINHSIYVGYCDTCGPDILPVLKSALVGVKAEIPETLTGRAPKWKYQDNRECTKCGWTGHEGEMTRERTLMGDGTFPCSCPSCGAGGMFSSAVKIADGFTLVEVVTDA